MQRFGVDPNEIEMILLTHLHADHFGGIPFFLLDSQFIHKRENELIIAGPPRSKERLKETIEAMFPGASEIEWNFPLRIVELEAGRANDFSKVKVTPHLVSHECGSPAFALRIQCDGNSVAYTGDTEWTHSLVAAAKGVDLLIAEAYYFEKKVRYHLDFRTLMDHIDELRPRRLIITHMSSEMLDRSGMLQCECAEDGKLVEL